MSNNTYTTQSINEWAMETFGEFDAEEYNAPFDKSYYTTDRNNSQHWGGWNEKVHSKINWSKLRSGKNNSMYGRKRAGTFSEECLEKKRQSMMGKNTCRVQIHGVEYPSIKAAGKDYPKLKIRYRLDSPLHPDWIRLEPITHRK
jgi:hypothetical protein